MALVFVSMYSKMSRVNIIILCLLIAGAAAAGDSHVLRTVHDGGLQATVVRIRPENNLGFSIIDVPAVKAGDGIRSHWRPGEHALMVNGGYFNDDFSPTGYCRINGREINQTRSKALSGFVAIDRRGTLRLLTAKDDVSRFPTVLQSGPYVIDPGGRVGIKSRSGKEARRTLIGTSRSRDIVIMITEPIYLFDLAVAVKRRFPELERLLNLDGGPSTALKTETTEIPNVLPVRNYIVKTVK